MAFGRGWRWPLRAEDMLEVWDGTELVTTLPAAVVYQVLGLLGALRALDARIGPARAAPKESSLVYEERGMTCGYMTTSGGPPDEGPPRLLGLGERHLRYTQRPRREGPP